MDLRVESWAQLHEELFRDSWQPEIRRHRLSQVFRGMSRAERDLRSSLMRLGGDFVPLERHLLRNFAKYSTAHVAPAKTTWELLSLAQHHGLPTRLLDWTYSPYVALHFVTEFLTSFDHDGVIWTVDTRQTNALLPRPLQDLLEREGPMTFTVEMLDEAAHSLADLEALQETPFVLFLEPPSLDTRIVNQYALFSITSHPDVALYAWLQEHAPPQAHRRIVIPAALKWEIRDKLDQAGINERVLFPGLDGLSRWLRRYYGPRT